MKFDLKRVEFSRRDRSKGITIPTNLEERLAEILGAHVGDGHLRFAPPEYKITFSGHKTDDNDYFRERLNGLLNCVFGVRFSVSESKRTNEFRFYMDSKAISTFYLYAIGLPTGRKDNIGVPRVVMDSPASIKCAFLRGYMDTDGAFCMKGSDYQRSSIKAASSSKPLIQGVSLLLKGLGFKISTRYDIKTKDKRTGKTYTQHEVYINGRKNLELWMERIGFGNKKHLMKVQKYLNITSCKVPAS